MKDTWSELPVHPGDNRFQHKKNRVFTKEAFIPNLNLYRLERPGVSPLALGKSVVHPVSWTAGEDKEQQGMRG